LDGIVFSFYTDWKSDYSQIKGLMIVLLNKMESSRPLAARTASIFEEYPHLYADLETAGSLALICCSNIFV